MECALCKSKAPLRNSHIIPEFLYKLLYDHLHRFHYVSTDVATPEKYVQKGLREDLLCSSCEQVFSRFEKYAKESFVDGKNVSVTRQGELFHFSGLDYPQFKLFLMSLIWRMGISKADFFEEVQLGKHLELLRKALLAGNPLSPEDYPCLITLLTFDGEYCHDWILRPFHTKLHGHHCYAAVINGFLFLFIISSHHLHNTIASAFLDKANELIVAREDVRNIEPLKRAAYELGKAMRARKG